MMEAIRRACTKTTEVITALLAKRRQETHLDHPHDNLDQIPLRPEVLASGFPFLKLPPELRNTIYRLVLIEIDIHGIIFPIPLTQPPIARVNRMTRTESLGIFYGENTFRMPITLRDPTATDLEYEQESLPFLRSVRLLASSGNFNLIDQLDITCEPRDAGFYRLRVRISNQKPPVFIREEPSPDYRRIIPVPDGRWDVNDVDGGYTDWNDMDSVKFAMFIQKLMMCGMLMEDGSEEEAECMKNMPFGQISEVLYLLLSGNGGPKFIFLSAER